MRAHTHTRTTHAYTHVPRVRLCGRRHGRTMTSRRPSRGLFWGRNGGKGFGQTASPGGFKFFIILLSLSHSIGRHVERSAFRRHRRWGGGDGFLPFPTPQTGTRTIIVIWQKATVLRTGIRGCYGLPRGRVAGFENSF